MDKVRFGRALGKGARGAAKSLWEAAEAATSPDPRSETAPKAAPGQRLSDVVAPVIEAHRTVHHAKQQVRAEAGRAGKSMLAPVRKFSSVLWLEVTGTFFTLIAVFVGQAVWKLRGTWRGPKFFVYAGLFALFAYFAVSSFVRARRRDRQ
jgi:hypothetical protein